MRDATSTQHWLADAPEFEDAVRAAAEHHGMLPDLVRKDYWVTRVLRAIATDPGLAGRTLSRVAPAYPRDGTSSTASRRTSISC